MKNATHLIAVVAIAATCLMPFGDPAIADDGAPAPTSTPAPPDPYDPCDTTRAIINSIADLDSEVEDQKASLNELAHVATLREQDLRKAYAIISRKDRRIARLERKIRVMRTGLHDTVSH